LTNTILFYPLADSCPNGCLYCFEDPSFRKENVFTGYDKYKMAESVKRLVENGKGSPQVILHGGEILALPIPDLEFFLSEIKKYNESPNVQTGLGVPITQEHIRLFRSYNVFPGTSVDGPPEFNCLRGPRDLENNKKFQEVVVRNIQTLKESGLKFGNISILSKANASPDKIDKLIEWSLCTTYGGRFNPLFVPWYKENEEILQYALTPKELSSAFLKLLNAAIRNPSFEFALFKEVASALLGDFRSVCTFNRCDYLITSCSPVLPDGTVARCDRCFQDGYYLASQKPSDARWKMLEQTECKGCRYFVACAGGCPGEGQNGDFRSKTVYCEAYYTLFQAVENMLRKMFPGIFLTIDIHNYYEEYVIPGKRFNPFMRWDGIFTDTLRSMSPELKLLGWTPDSEMERKNPGSTGTTKNKHGILHSDSNSRASSGSGCGCGCGK